MLRPYRGYRAQKKRRNIIVLVALLVLALLAFLLYPMLEQNITGGLGIFANTDPRKEPVPNLIIEQPAAGPSAESPAAPPANDADPEQNLILPISAVFAPVERLTDAAYVDSLLSLVSLSGLNAVVFDVKTDDGYLYYRSEVAAAVQSGAPVSDFPADAVRRLRENDVRIIARMSAFRDNLVPRNALRPAAVKTQSGVTWLDYKSFGWFSPYSDEAHNYLTSLIAEIAPLVDEIMLTNCSFPVSGKLEMISYADGEKASRTQAVGAFLDRAVKAAGDRCALSVHIYDTTIRTGLDADAGQDLAEISDICGRIFFTLPSSPGEAELLLESVDESLPGAITGGRATAVASSAPAALSGRGCLLVRESGEYSAAELS